MEKNYLFKVKTIEKINEFLPEGSCIYVEKKLKKHYKGIHTSMNGTYLVKVPKNKCVKLDDLK